MRYRLLTAVVLLAATAASAQLVLHWDEPDPVDYYQEIPALDGDPTIYGTFPQSEAIPLPDGTWQRPALGICAPGMCRLVACLNSPGACSTPSNIWPTPTPTSTITATMTPTGTATPTPTKKRPKPPKVK